MNGLQGRIRCDRVVAATAVLPSPGARGKQLRSGQVKFRLGRQVIQATYERILAQSNLKPTNQKMPTAKCLDVLDLHIVLYGS